VQALISQGLQRELNSQGERDSSEILLREVNVKRRNPS